MNIIKSLHDAILEDDGQPNAVPVSFQAPPVTSSSAALALSVPVSGGQLDSLRGKIIQPAASLSLLGSTLASLKAFIPDETARFNAAVAALGAQGVTPAKLQAEVQSCMASLNREKQLFAQRKNEKETSEITAKEQRIAELTVNIQSAEAEKQKIAGEVSVARAKLEAVAAGFSAASQSLQAELEGILSKLGGVK